MAKLILKLFLFALLALVLSIPVRKILRSPEREMPWSYSFDALHLKREYLRTHPAQFNLLFIGSSSTRRGFVPQVFNENTDSTLAIHSFNYGVDWMGFPEVYYMLDHVLKENTEGTRYIFIELSKIKIIDYQNMHTARAIYWYNWSDFKFTIASILSSPSPPTVKVAALSSHTIGYIDHLLNAGSISDRNDYHKRQTMVTDSIAKMDKSYAGYSGKEAHEDAGLAHFLNDTSGLTTRKINSAQAFEELEKNPELIRNYNHVYLDRINSTIQNLLATGIYPVFVMNPRADPRQYKEILTVFYNIDPRYRIEIADSRKYPDLYAVENASDETHLNEQGAVLYTKYLAREFNKLVLSNSRPDVNKP
ncbi:MAG: hypothetical protein IPO39_03440 [Bacteroidetes bacterium]|nr:hypothetical protein [Bacteroidota bacterium]